MIYNGKVDNTPKLIFTKNRTESSTIRISEEKLENRKQLKVTKMESVITYTENNTVCRTQQLLRYFGEENNFKCGKCDVCVERRKIDLSDLDFKNIQTKIKDLLLKKKSTSIEIINGITNSREEKILKVLQWLSDNGKVKLTENKYSWIA